MPELDGTNSLSGEGGPLRGVRVVDLSSFIAGPYATMTLGDWGAEVVKIEPLNGEPSRHLGPSAPGGLSATAIAMNRNKRSIALDYGAPETAEVIRAVVRRSDVLVHNLLPSALERMGLSNDTFCADNDQLVLINVTAFGAGRDSDRPGLDPTFQAASGLMSVTGTAESAPTRVGSSVVDVSSGMMSASAALLGLVHRTNTRSGCTIVISMLEVALALQSSTYGLYLFDGSQPARMGNASPFTFTDSYRTEDGDIVISIVSERSWQDLCEIVDDPRLSSDRYQSNDGRLEHRRFLHSVVEEQLKQKPRSHWITLLRDRRIPYGEVADYRDALEYALSQNEDVLVDPGTARAPRSSIANPIAIQGNRRTSHRPPPTVGEHTKEILDEIGWSHPHRGSTSKGAAR